MLVELGGRTIRSKTKDKDKDKDKVRYKNNDNDKEENKDKDKKKTIRSNRKNILDCHWSDSIVGEPGYIFTTFYHGNHHQLVSHDGYGNHHLHLQDSAFANKHPL